MGLYALFNGGFFTFIKRKNANPIPNPNSDPEVVAREYMSGSRTKDSRTTHRSSSTNVSSALTATALVSPIVQKRRN